MDKGLIRKKRMEYFWEGGSKTKDTIAEFGVKDRSENFSEGRVQKLEMSLGTVFLGGEGGYTSKNGAGRGSAMTSSSEGNLGMGDSQRGLSEINLKPTQGG